MGKKGGCNITPERDSEQCSKGGCYGEILPSNDLGIGVCDTCGRRYFVSARKFAGGRYRKRAT